MGSCEGGMVFLHHSSAEKMVRNTKGGPTLALASERLKEGIWKV
jgi:hypothetical protein